MKTIRFGQAILSISLMVVLLLGFIPLQFVHAVSLEWTLTNPTMHEVRSEETATVLNNSKVLVAGGVGDCGGENCYLSSAELYQRVLNPDHLTYTETWTYTSNPMNVPRKRHTATLLADGKVLVTGGINSLGAVSSAELYNPTTGQWTQTPPMASARYFHTATRLLNGQVLVVGGICNGSACSSSILNTAELYDPFSNTWIPTGSLATKRNSHTATLLPNGQVLVVGGSSTNNIFGALDTAEVYTPSTGTWQTLANHMTTPRWAQTATILTSGKVLVVGGGNSSGYLKSSELFDPGTGLWDSAIGTMSVERYYHTATLVTFVDGHETVLVAGGLNAVGAPLASAELYNPGTKSWTTTGSLHQPRFGHATVQLLDGNVLAAGGGTASGSLATAELYDPTAPTAAPAVPVTVSPNGNTITEVSYVWNQSSGATAYNLRVYHESNPTTPFLDELVNATFCTAGICTYKPAAPLAVGNYLFKVSAGNVFAYSAYSADRTFIVRPNFQISGNISGNAGTDFMKLSYYDNGLKEVSADASGNYTLTVTFGWSGTVTPSLTGYIFTPPSRTYEDPVVANKSGENYAATPLRLTVVRAGNGTGTVTSAPVGINCGADCNEIYPLGKGVTLSAAPDISSIFTPGWSGSGCSGTGTCVVTMNAPHSVTASFTLKTFTVNVSFTGLGSGTITSDIAGINCPGDCSETYNYGTVVTLTAAPVGVSAFTGWGGACSGRNPCALTITSDNTVSADFAHGYDLNVVHGGNGTGSVTSNPAGINCGADCFQVYDVGTLVTLTATATGLTRFGGWSGGGCSGTGTCQVTMDGRKVVTATFILYKIYLPMLKR